ncbi:signal transduction diguanylate cyclase [Oleiphilus messinensis]|uniref:diguanylate cyclase n=1 Tax=Oleiphilus messinensis TaxID=141451 RepID=A0A1Y0IDK4_9GAMM|nr:GGDEF domain-containing protein [Oleiphilus messinensis]ARU57463.1 signal transduction diguanylate cyclase [Oleiphilus messinensis]
MSTNLPKAETIDFTKARLASTFNEINKHLEEPEDIYTRLCRRLQTTLDVESILTIFLQELSVFVNFGVFTFKTEDAQIRYATDKPQTHSCNYTVQLNDNSIGVIEFSRSIRYSEEELNIFENLLTTLIFPLRNAILYRQALEAALTDSLTGIGNKRALDANLHRETELASRHKTPLSVIVFDLDRFKQVNDQFGHVAGDQVLKSVVRCVVDSCRASDLCFRSGGEEFTILLSETHTAGARIIAERIRERVAALEIEYQGDIIPVTISMGTATYSKGETITDWISRADAALYRAKNDGRNRAYSAESGRRAPL